VTLAISNLRARPAFSDTVADRVWRAWWEARATSLGDLRAWVDGSLSVSPLPFSLVAHDGSDFAGTASVIASDLDERPQYSPWVAAVWVEPAFRHRGVGRALVARAAAETFAIGVPGIYLCARANLRDFYACQGWSAIEHDVGERQLTVFTMEAP